MTHKSVVTLEKRQAEMLDKSYLNRKCLSPKGRRKAAEIKLSLGPKRKRGKS